MEVDGMEDERLVRTFVPIALDNFELGVRWLLARGVSRGTLVGTIERIEYEILNNEESDNGNL